ncbi:MAG: HAD-IIIC family phosphatase [Tissierellia bacterium]|nr:HAD-IIIC family phosphatase [Tissierellia bacterium]
MGNAYPGNAYPGNAYLDFQRYIIQLVKNGLILAICSKNNESDVFEVWEKNKNCLITNEYISAYRINWQNKAENIKELLEELNIGADSVVFIDDSPTERELVKQFHPTIEVPEFPSQPYMLQKFIVDIIHKYFRVYSLTKEDQNKTMQYKENIERKKFATNFTDISEYIASLDIVIQLYEANSFTIPRIAQMTQKTNQFNLTTRRYDETQINAFLENGKKIYCIGVKDKFGDNGITGLIIYFVNNRQYTATIDTLLLSCRILGKGIEEAFCYTIFNKLKKERIKVIYAEYIPTTKNKQVENFYEKLNFTLVAKSANGQKKYKLNIESKEFIIKPYYKIVEDYNERED